MPEGVGNISTFTNNSDAPITIRPEAKVGGFIKIYIDILSKKPFLLIFF